MAVESTFAWVFALNFPVPSGMKVFSLRVCYTASEFGDINFLERRQLILCYIYAQP